MKASDAKKYIGKEVKYQRTDWPWPRAGRVVEIIGRNIVLDNDTLWAPDIETMEEVKLAD